MFWGTSLLFSYSGCTYLHSHQQYEGVPFSPNLHQYLLFVDFFDDNHSDRYEVISLTVVLICISLIISDVWHLFLCLLVICLFKLFVLFFFNWIVCFLFDIELYELFIYFDYQALISHQLSSFAQLCLILCDPLNYSTPGFPVHHQLLKLAQLCPLSWWCHPTILSSVVPFSSWLQSFPALGSFLMSQPFTSGAQSNGASVQHQSFQ